MAIIKSLAYTIYIQNAACKRISVLLKKRNYSTLFLLCDTNTHQHCLPHLLNHCPELNKAHIIQVKSGESSKSISTCTDLWNQLMKHKAGKDALLINLGGGVVSDLGGFCASVYKRGIDFINVPTSLLSMADASVGGKTGIDFGGLKNSLGTITQPQAVFIDPLFLNTLSSRHFKNGLAEIVKIALAADKQLWQQLGNALRQLSTEQLITKSVTLKNKIVISDPYDKSIRRILNLGHSIGHAVEIFYLNTKTPLLHGEAVFIGLLIESHIALQKQLITEKQFFEIASVLTSHLPKQKKLPLQKLLQLLQHDKKNQNNSLLFSLPQGIGGCKYNVAVNKEEITKAIQYYNQLRP